MRHTSYCSLFLTCALLVALAGCGQPATDTPKPADEHPVQQIAKVDFQPYLDTLVRDHIQPGYDAFAVAANNLKVQIGQQCKGNGQAPDWLPAQMAWRDTMARWQYINWLQLGPVSEQNRYVRIQFWPDSNNAVSRGLAKLIQSPELPGMERMARFNVGAQGLPALEHVLFDTTLEMRPERRCALAGLIAENLDTMATEVALAWQQQDGYAEQVISGTGAFTSVSDAAEELMSNWLALLPRMLDNKLTYPLGVASPGIPPLAESPVADHSLVNLQQNLLAIEAVYRAGTGEGLGRILVNRQQTELASNIQQHLTRIISLSRADERPFSELLKDESGRKHLIALKTQLGELQELLTDEMVDALDVSLGFNALDGD